MPAMPVKTTWLDDYPTTKRLSRLCDIDNNNHQIWHHFVMRFGVDHSMAVIRAEYRERGTVTLARFRELMGVSVSHA